MWMLCCSECYGGAPSQPLCLLPTSHRPLPPPARCGQSRRRQVHAGCEYACVCARPQFPSVSFCWTQRSGTGIPWRRVQFLGDGYKNPLWLRDALIWMWILWIFHCHNLGTEDQVGTIFHVWPDIALMAQDDLMISCAPGLNTCVKRPCFGIGHFCSISVFSQMCEAAPMKCPSFSQ